MTTFYESSHDPYFKFEDGEILPVMGFEQSVTDEYVPLVPGGDGNLVKAHTIGPGVVVSGNEEGENKRERELLYG